MATSSVEQRRSRVPDAGEHRGDARLAVGDERERERVADQRDDREVAPGRPPARERHALHGEHDNRGRPLPRRRERARPPSGGRARSATLMNRKLEPQIALSATKAGSQGWGRGRAHGLMNERARARVRGIGDRAQFVRARPARASPARARRTRSPQARRAAARRRGGDHRARPRAADSRRPRALAQQRGHVVGGVKRVGDRRVVGERQRDAQDALDLGEQKRPGGHLGAVERGEPEQRPLVAGVGEPDRDRGVKVVRERLEGDGHHFIVMPPPHERK